MSLKEHVYSVLLVSSSDKFNSTMREMLPESDFTPVCTVGSIGEAQRTLTERTFDFVIINSPLPDDSGIKLAIDVCLGKTSVALLIVKTEVYDEIFYKVAGSGVLTLRKPMSAALLNQSFDWMKAICERLRSLQKKTVSLEDKMAEIRIVNRAKWALIESCKMTEADAHRYIEKQAMDRCVTRREIAEGILRTYTGK